MSTAYTAPSIPAGSFRVGVGFALVSVLQFIASLVHSLAWPAAVIVAVLVLRHQLRALLAGPVRRMRAGPFEMEWERTAKEVEAVLPHNRRESPSAPTGDLMRELASLIEGAPREAIEKAYERLLEALWSHYPQAAPDDSDAVEMARMAFSHDYISKDSVRAVEGLTAMRNLTLYRPATEVTPARAGGVRRDSRRNAVRAQAARRIASGTQALLEAHCGFTHLISMLRNASAMPSLSGSSYFSSISEPHSAHVPAGRVSMGGQPRRSRVMGHLVHGGSIVEP